MSAMKGLLRLILVPAVLTLIVSVLRVWLEVQGVIGSRSGGGLAWLGISWLPFLFGGWFGLRLRRSGSRPLLPWAPLFALVALAAIVVTIGMQFGAVDRSDQSEAAYAALRGRVNIIVLVGTCAAAFCFLVWPKLATTMLLYAIPARVTVLAITWLARQQGWDTHYTKFGPAGIERDMGETVYAATVAQMGFWVGYTVVAGTLVGSITALTCGEKPVAGRAAAK